LAADGGEWSASGTGYIIPGETDPSTHWVGGWVDSRAILDIVAKRKDPCPCCESKPN